MNKTYILIDAGYDWWPNWQTKDILSPRSQVITLSSWSPMTFTVRWAGEDRGEAGLRSYDVQYKDGSAGDWTDWLLDTRQTQAVFVGEEGHEYCFQARARDYAYNVESYYFQSRARDNGGNLEAYIGGDGDTRTLVDQSPPTSAASSPAHSPTANFVVSWSGDDGTGSGIASYDVQFRDGLGGLWTDWFVEATGNSAAFAGEPGHTYYFQSRARDQLGHLEDYPGGDGDTFTETPSHVLSGRVLGNREQPIAFAVVRSTPPLSNTALSGFDGGFYLYYDISGTVALSVSRGGFGDLPAMHGVSLSASPTDVVFYLPPVDDRITDGGFEAGDLSAWQVAGEIPPRLGPLAHTGDGAATLGGTVPDPVVTPTLDFGATGIFSQAGGVLTATLVTVDVPPGAVSGTVLLTVTGVPTVSALPTGTQDVGPHLVWSAALTDGTPLTATLLPLRLTVSYQDSTWQSAQIDGEQSLSLWRYDPLSATWRPLSGTLDPLSDTIVVAMVEPSLLALLGTPYQGPWHGVLEQEVLLSPTLVLGKLSLLYRVEGAGPISETLSLSVLGPTRTVSYTPSLMVRGWTHRWWVLPAWADLSLTLRLEWMQEQRTSSLLLLLDEVSIGSAVEGVYPIYMPLILRAYP